MINWRLLAGFAIAGGVISILAGLAGRNPFGTILLRMLVSAAIFSGLGLGLSFLLRRYFPDLLRGGPPRKQPEGNQVDIVIDEDLPLEPDSLLGPEPGADTAGADTARADTAGAEPGTEADAGSLGTLEEIPEEAPEAEGERRGAARRGGAPGSTGTAEPGADTASADTAGSGADEPPGELELDSEDFSVAPATGRPDTLPDMDQLDVSEPTEAPAKSGEATRSRARELAEGQDPSELAKAVRTFLRKDQGS
jgi:hypothetical protein